MPPPSTRSNSSMPDETRASDCDSISPNRTGFTSRSRKPPRAAMPFDAVAAGRAFSSTKELHSPQSGHFPSHLPDCFPQF
jgi:hypothetical protein